MANTVTAVLGKLAVSGLHALRELAVMPRLVNTSIGDSKAREKGDTIDVPISSASTTRNVTPNVAGPTNQDTAPTKVQIALSQWKENTFFLTDKDQSEIMSREGYIGMQASEAIKGLANTVDSYILGFYKGIFNAGGTGGTTPFATNLTAFKDARRLMNISLAPPGDRRVVLDADAEANALDLSKFLDADTRGDQGGMINGVIGRKLGADWFLDQNIPTHTIGTISRVTSVLTNGATTAGTSTIVFDNATITGTLVTGDIFTLAGDTQTYVVTATATFSGNAVTVNFKPDLKVTAADGVAVTFAGTHQVNLLFHRDAFAFASRPFLGEQDDQSVSAIDPVSGLALRVERHRGWKQTTWGYDILYGAQLVRPALAARILG